jgi:hypothetical protein
MPAPSGEHDEPQARRPEKNGEDGGGNTGNAELQDEIPAQALPEEHHLPDVAYRPS